MGVGGGSARRRNLLRRHSAVGEIPYREMPFAFDMAVGAHSGDQRFGHIASVNTGETNKTAPAQLPRWFAQLAPSLPGEALVFMLRDAVHAACISAERPRGKQRSCVLYVGNKEAPASLRKGSSSTELGAHPASPSWPCAARGNTLWWIEYVHT